MTCLEKYKQDNPTVAMNSYGNPKTCPHKEGYKERPDWCVERWDEQVCCICWNRKLTYLEE